MWGFLTADSAAGRANNDSKKWNNYTHPHKYNHSSPQWTTPLWVCLSLSLSPPLPVSSCSPLQHIDPHCYWHLKGAVWLFEVFFTIFLKPHSSFCLCLYFSTSLLKTPLCQAPKPGCGLVLARQWAMQAFFSHSGLLSGVFALTCVQLGLLYPHYWLQVMFWTQSSWPRRGLRYIIVRRGTSGDWTEAAAHVLSSLTLSSRWISSTKCFWHKRLERRFQQWDKKKKKKIMQMLHRQTSTLQLLFPEWPSMHRTPPLLHLFLLLAN